MTIDLNELERPANACFVGPWEAKTWAVDCSCVDDEGYPDDCGIHHDVETVLAPNEYPKDPDCPQVVAQIDGTVGGEIRTTGFEQFAKPHAEFIAAARTAVPELIVMVRELKLENRKLRADSQNEAYRRVAENAVRVGDIRVVNSSDANKVDALFEEKENLRKHLVSLIEAIADVEDDDLDHEACCMHAGTVASMARRALVGEDGQR